MYMYACSCVCEYNYPYSDSRTQFPQVPILLSYKINYYICYDKSLGDIILPTIIISTVGVHPRCFGFLQAVRTKQI